jgi:PAS domain S-box-containing protein
MKDSGTAAAANDTLRYHASLVDAMTDAVIATDADFRVTAWNPAAERLYGYRAEEALGRFARDLATFEGDDSRRELETALERAGRAQIEFTACRRNGEFVDVDLITTRVHDEAGDIVGYLGIHRDITEQRRVETEYRRLSAAIAHSAAATGERQSRQQAAVAQLGAYASRGEKASALMDEAVAVVARTLDVELVAIAELLADRAQFRLRAGTGWMPDRPEHVGADSLMAAAVRTGEPLVSSDIDRHDRVERWSLLGEHDVTSAAVVAIPGQAGAFGALAVCSREQRRFDASEVNFLRAIANVLHGALERAAMAHRVHEVRDAERRRLARALHDDTLPELGVALLRADAGAGDKALVPTLQRIGDQIRAAIDDLRLDDRPDRPFRELVEDLVNAQRPAAPDCEFVLDLGDMPDRLPGDMGDHALRIIGEALTNARRHARAKRIQTHVSVSGGHLVAAVTDDGDGLVRRPQAPGGGHGIAGMRERTTLLAGQLHIARRPGGGTAVELRVPLAGPKVPHAARARVLLVDDHAAIREALANAFAADDGLVVVGQAGSLAEARQLLDDVDIAIIDIELPDGDGGELIAELRAASPDAQALVLSAHVDRASTAKLVESGAAAVLSKATHLHEVVAAVRRLRAGETLIPLQEMVDLLRFASGERERELGDRRRIERLTPREREILQLLADGLDGRGVADRLYISPRTQRNHMANILGKLGVHSQLQAVVFALRHGIVDAPRGGVGQMP